MRYTILTTLLGSLMLQAGTTPPVQVWTAADIQSRGRALAQKLDANKVATDNIGTVGNRSFLIAHREGSGLAEVHDTQADLIVISSGEVTMVYGGSVVEGKTTAAGETRGSAIQGGTEKVLGPGDVLHIPAKIPHQMKLAPGAQVTYFVAKVVER
jgi:uncharacterized RmlC-like cupin family protein